MNLPTYREVYFYEDGKPIGKLFDFQISDYLYNYATEQNRKAEQKITGMILFSLLKNPFQWS